MNQYEYKKYLVETGIGLQKVDGLEPPGYVKETLKSYYEKDSSLEEISDSIDQYFKKHKNETKDREIESSIVALRIIDVLKDKSFVFSVGQYLAIHKRLFEGIIDNAGKLRTYNIEKEEKVICGHSVIYGDYRDLATALEYDLNAERKYSYEDKTMDEIIEHLRTFVSNLWQIHPFGEGNTRTTSVFFIKYLRTLGFDVTNDAFSKNAKYFRNSLVRANYSNIRESVFSDNEYLTLFLRNLLLNENNVLDEEKIALPSILPKRMKREITLTAFEIDVLFLIKNSSHITSKSICEITGKSLRTVKYALSSLQSQNIIKRINGKKYGHWEIIDKGILPILKRR